MVPVASAFKLRKSHADKVIVSSSIPGIYMVHEPVRVPEDSKRKAVTLEKVNKKYLEFADDYAMLSQIEYNRRPLCTVCSADVFNWKLSMEENEYDYGRDLITVTLSGNNRDECAALKAAIEGPPSRRVLIIWGGRS